MCQQRGLCLLLGNTICLFLMYFTSLALLPTFHLACSPSVLLWWNLLGNEAIGPASLLRSDNKSLPLNTQVPQTGCLGCYLPYVWCVNSTVSLWPGYGIWQARLYIDLCVSACVASVIPLSHSKGIFCKCAPCDRQCCLPARKSRVVGFCIL